MGFLDKLWDETLAGPMPESGLGKLRKYDSFSAARPSPIKLDDVRISRSITILRANSSLRHFSADSGAAPTSLAGPSTPTTPFTPAGTPRGDFKKMARRKSAMEALEPAEPRSPTVHDWIVFSALDR